MKTKDKDWLTSEKIIYAGIIWATIASIGYLSFSIVENGVERPLWFTIATTAIEQIALLGASFLCWRNWQSKFIPSGRIVWLLFAIAMAVFFTGNLCFSAWELLWGLDPAASAGNPWFVIFYLLTIAGMRLAITHEQVVLNRTQWAVVAGIGTFGIIMAIWLTAAVPKLPATNNNIATINTATQTISALPSAPTIIKQKPQPPAWVSQIDRSMQPAIGTFNLFYVLCDLVLLIFAAILFLGFWGGHLGQPWLVVALGVLCFYISDLWFAYANTQISEYRSGFIMEIFWIFGIVQFGIAAALEFDNAQRSRRFARRRHVPK
jgi:hypothetical protein